MDKTKERGILKLEPRTREKCELTPQGSYERVPSSPQPSVDRLSVTWADPSMAASGVNLFHLPADTAVNNEVKFSPAGDVSEDEDYSVSLSAVLRQRRCSVRRSRKGRRRTSSPFMPDDTRARRRSSVFTTSSGETAISMDDPGVVTQEEIFKNIRMHKEVLSSVKQQPLGLRRKLKLVHTAKGYIKCHEGQLQERLAQSKNTRDIYARFNILLAAKWQQLKREAANTSNILIPWELRIKEIESHFGSVVASYFTFLRWLFWVNLVIGFILLVFVIVPECLIGNVDLAGERKKIRPEDQKNATNLVTLWEFEGVLKVSPIFYGYYSNIESSQYRMPLAYFLTGLVVYIYSFVAILRKMAENSRMSKLSEKEDECIFSWKLFTGWDYMIGNTETAQNRAASVILGFKEALLEEAEKKKDLRNWRVMSLRAGVNLFVVFLLALSVSTVVSVVSADSNKPGWLNENMTTIVVTVISILFPYAFELLGLLERYHPRRQLRWLLARIMLLNLLNLFSLIFALFRKIQGMSDELEHLKPVLNESSNLLGRNDDINETIAVTVPILCSEITKSCLPYDMLLSVPTVLAAAKLSTVGPTVKAFKANSDEISKLNNKRVNQIKVIKSKPNVVSPSIDKQPAKVMPPGNLIENYNTNISPTEASLIKSFEMKWNISDTGYVSETDQSGEDQSVNYYDDTTINWTETTDSVVYRYDSTNYSGMDFNYTRLNHYGTDKTDISTMEDDNSIDWNFTMSSPSTVELAYTMTETPADLGSTEISTESTTTESTNTTNAETTSYESLVTRAGTNDSFSTNKFNRELETTPTDIPYTNMDNNEEIDLTVTTEEETLFDVSTIRSTEIIKFCPDAVFNCTMKCGEENVTQMIFMSNCQVKEKRCFVTRWESLNKIMNESLQANMTNSLERDIVYFNSQNMKMYNLSSKTRSKLVKLCWETMFGQELVKLTLMDLVFLIFSTLFLDFFRALFVRYMNRCWCWDLEKKFPEYGDFKIAENILHLINNQGMVWMGMFFSPGLVVLNVFKLVIMMYLRSWAVMTCNVPHEVVFRVSKSNNFYLGLLLTMLFLCVLPVGYSIVWVKPSWHCGPFSEHEKIYEIVTKYLYSLLPDTLNFAVKYIASPAIVIPLLVLLILIIYYLISLTNSLREANNDLKIQLRRERTEERRKMFQLVDTRRRGQSAMDNTPFARWKKALPGLPMGKSIDSDDRKGATEEDGVRQKPAKKKGSFLANLVGQIVEKKSDFSELENDVSLSPKNGDETDTDFHETLPKEILKVKDITITKTDKKNVEFNTTVENVETQENHNLKVKVDTEDRTDKAAVRNRYNNASKSRCVTSQVDEVSEKKLNRKQTSESSTHSKQSDVGSVIPVITISTTESDDDCLHAKDKKKYDKKDPEHKKQTDLKSLRRQSSVDSVQEQKLEKKKPDEGHKYQYSL